MLEQNVLERGLKGRALEKHIALGFAVYWRGVAR